MDISWDMTTTKFNIPHQPKSHILHGYTYLYTNKTISTDWEESYFVSLSQNPSCVTLFVDSMFFAFFFRYFAGHLSQQLLFDWPLIQLNIFLVSEDVDTFLQRCGMVAAKVKTYPESINPNICISICQQQGGQPYSLNCGIILEFSNPCWPLGQQ